MSALRHYSDVCGSSGAKVLIISRQYCGRGLFYALAASSLFAIPNIAYAQTVVVDYTQPVPSELSDAITEALPDDQTPKTALQARRQAKRAKTIIANTLNSYGYYDPTLTISVVEIETRPVPQVKIQTGPVFIRLGPFQFTAIRNTVI